jgi:SAM-dependent methyltransferase
VPRWGVTHHSHAPAHSHGAAPGEDDVFDWDHRGAEMEREAELDLGWIEQSLEWMATGLGTVQRAVDLGSGPGVATAALATAFPTATVTAVDGSPALLERAAVRAARMGLDERVDTLQHDLSGDPALLPEADLIWMSRVLHHLPDPEATLGALRKRLRPGGRIGLVEGGLPPRWAPDDLGMGRPGLQARLDVATGDLLFQLPVPHGIRPGTDWAALLAAAGFIDVTTRSWLDEVPAPAPEAVRARVRDRLTMVRDHLRPTLDPLDLAVVDRLLDPADPLGVDRRPDLFWLAAQTVYTGRAAEDDETGPRS